MSSNLIESRAMRRLAAILAFISLGVSAGGVAAEEPHLAFVQGLRNKHYPDLALEYLQKLSQNPPAEFAAFLPLELARTRLELAKLEPDLARRDVQYTQARGEFETFLQKNSNHPLAAEANFEI